MALPRDTCVYVSFFHIKWNKIKNKTGASCHKRCISVTIRHWGNEK